MSSLDALQSLGVTVRRDKEVRKEFGTEDNKDVDIKPPIIHIDGGNSLMAVRMGLIPKAFENTEFDIQHIKENVSDQARVSARKFKVKRFKNYTDTLTGILSSIRMGKIPQSSYLIGAPNGFGKTSFVTTAIKLMYSQGWNAVPYISLSELAGIRAEHERSLVRGIEVKSRKSEEFGETVYQIKDSSTFVKMPKVITGCYSWSEYINSDILYCFFSSLDSKVIESHTLKGILEIRGAKGLPTVVFISTSLEPYKSDYNLREYVWEEILAYKEDINCFDRVYHTSCYKQATNIIGEDLDIGIE